jgi:hypothetical protein
VRPTEEERAKNLEAEIVLTRTPAKKILTSSPVKSTEGVPPNMYRGAGRQVANIR